MEVAETILSQLGGQKFRVMTGAGKFVGSRDSLSFRFPKARKNINACRITLTPADVYKVVFANIRGVNYTEVECVENVYADSLQTVFTAHTGLDTHL